MSGSGYVIEKEDRQYLEALPGDDAVMRMMGTFEEVRLDPRKLMRTENQRNMGACAGHSLSTNEEWLYCIASGGETVQLSRMQAYVMAQELDGIKGDSGSTVSAGIKLGKTFGLCVESLWPYPASYTSARPSNWEEVKESSAKHKIGNAVTLTTYEAVRTWLGSGQGGCHTGISWGDSMNRAIVERFIPGGGGHSTAWLCLSERTDQNGDPFIWNANSWGESFGSREYPGWQEISPTAIRQILAHQYTVVIGVSDMPNVKPRTFSLDDLKKSLRV